MRDGLSAERGRSSVVCGVKTRPESQSGRTGSRPWSNKALPTRALRDKAVVENIVESVVTAKDGWR